MRETEPPSRNIEKWIAIFGNILYILNIALSSC